MSKIIECIDLCKVYERKLGMRFAATAKKFEEIKTVALDKISLGIEEGEFVVIMGPSGSGKSTLLNTISTLDIPTSGKLFFNGVSINKIINADVDKFRGEKLGFIFQNFNVLPNLTVLENIAVPLNLNSKKTVEEVRMTCEEIAEKVGIKDILKKYPVECSGGQIQRISIARALVTNPNLILADEPTGNLDSKNSHEVLSILKEFNDKDKKTIVMVTHDNMIASYGHRVIFLRDGKIERELIRGEMNQSEFFYKIVEINSKEARMLFK
ncbi:ABC transporter ATP-binding protein [Cetobacterium sp.]|uniref:ABC transporter ATP-binding protein n=1 Tax=Cetobacterium sp. TaxID=2071632 RepID=UPI003F366A84